MARYIDADKLIERLKASPVFPHMGMDGDFLLDCVVDLIVQQPTVGVVEVVRCKNCVAYHGYRNEGRKKGV